MKKTIERPDQSLKTARGILIGLALALTIWAGSIAGITFYLSH